MSKAQKNTTSIIANFFSDIIRFPQIVVINDEIDFVCPSTKDYSNLKEYTSLFSQVGTFTPIAGLLFSIFIYGAKSVFGIMTTCLIDDMVIIAASFGPILWWYTFAKPLWLFGIIHEIQKDTNYNYEFIYSIVLGILLGSMVVILILGSILRLHFHNRRNKLNEDSLWFHMSPKNYRLTNKEFFAVSTAFFVWGFFIHSIEVIIYSVLSYNYIFLTIFREFDELNSNNGSKVVVLATYHFPDLEKYIICIASENRLYHVFTVLLAIVLTRSITSFFSDSEVVLRIYNQYKDEKVYAEMEARNIKEVQYFYTWDKRLKKSIRCRFSSAGEYFYIHEEEEKFVKSEEKNREENVEEEKEEKEEELEGGNHGYYYVTIGDKWVYFYKLDYKYNKDLENDLEFFPKMKRYIFGKGALESGPIIEEIKKIIQIGKNTYYYKYEEFGKVKNIEFLLSDGKEFQKRKPEDNITEKNGTKIEVKRMEADDKVLPRDI
ncbi:12974_t:CDS:2 [Entrophospora sp. SA101]|nr:12974_t:CDS:2 [Entrophospora sp. SA101]